MDRLTRWNLKSVLDGVRGPNLSYQRASHESDGGEALLSEEKPSGDTTQGRDEGSSSLERQSRPRAQWIIRYMLFVLGLVVYSFLLVALVPRNCSDSECGKRVSVWSPLNEAIQYVEYDFDTAFDQKSVYRGPPSAELEAAWEKLLLLDPVPYPEDKLPLVNRTGGVLGGYDLARLQDEPGTPVAANFEVFHQLHCLNYLRQYTWRDWYFRHPDAVVIPSDMLSSDVGVRMHADHCIDLIREALICHGDTTPFFTVIDPKQSLGARGDFNAHHKCRDFGKLQQWVRDNSVMPGSGVGGQGQVHKHHDH